MGDNTTYILVVTNDEGRRFNVRMLWPGDRYGLDDCLIYRVNDGYGSDGREGQPPAGPYLGPQVEFYDATYQDDPRFPEIGQFVSRYYTGNLLDHKPGCGLILCGYQRQWTVSGRNMDEILAWVHCQIALYGESRKPTVECGTECMCPTH